MQNIFVPLHEHSRVDLTVHQLLVPVSLDSFEQRIKLFLLQYSKFADLFFNFEIDFLLMFLNFNDLELVCLLSNLVGLKVGFHCEELSLLFPQFAALAAQSERVVTVQHFMPQCGLFQIVPFSHFDHADLRC